MFTSYDYEPVRKLRKNASMNSVLTAMGKTAHKKLRRTNQAMAHWQFGNEHAGPNPHSHYEAASGDYQSFVHLFRHLCRLEDVDADELMPRCKHEHTKELEASEQYGYMRARAKDGSTFTRCERCLYVWETKPAKESK